MIKPREEHWREVAANYTLEPEPFSVELATEIETILREARIEPPSALLEAGCGSGHLSLELARRGWQADVLDFEPLAVANAEAAYKQTLGPTAKKYRFITGDLNNLDDVLKSRKYDVVWNSGVLEHFSAEALRHVLLQMGRAARQSVFFYRAESGEPRLSGLPAENENKVAPNLGGIFGATGGSARRSRRSLLRDYYISVSQFKQKFIARRAGPRHHRSFAGLSFQWAHLFSINSERAPNPHALVADG